MKYLLVVIVSVALSAGITFALLLNQKPSTENSSTSSTQTEALTEQTNDTLAIEQIKEKLSQLEASYAALLKNESSNSEKTPSQPQTITKYVNQSTSTFTNQVVFLGSATTNHRSWTQTGVEVSLNSADYPTGTTAKFEAGLKIIGGEAWARLVNKSTGAIISSTEVSHNTNTTTWKSASPFALHQGNNTYVVELRSSSGETAVLDGSRIILEK